MKSKNSENEHSPDSAAQAALLRQRLQKGSEDSRQSKPRPIATAPTSPVDLGPNQKPLWVDYQMFPERRGAWIVRGYELEGLVDASRLAEALEYLGQRHWYLSCAVNSNGQVVARDAAIPLDILTCVEDPWTRAADYSRNELPHFRLEQGELFRVILVHDKSSSALILAFHHILVDQRSVEILSDELDRIYTSGPQGLAPPPDPLVAYSRQRSNYKKRRAALEEFWREQLVDRSAPSRLPFAAASQLPVGGNGKLLRHRVSSDLAGLCKSAASKSGASPYQWFLSAWTVLLCRYLNRSDAQLGTMYSTRSGLGQAELVGCFQNAVAVNADLKETKSFDDVVTHVRSTIGDVIAHGDLPLDEVARLGSKHPGAPLFATMFTMLDTRRQSQMLQLPVSKVEELDYGGHAFDLTFFVITSDDDLSLAIEFDSSAYDEASSLSIFDHFESLLQQMATRPQGSWRKYSLANESQYAQALNAWQAIKAATAQLQKLHNAFYDCAARTPEAIALCWHGSLDAESVSYQTLADEADAVAGFIAATDASPDKPVAVLGAWQPDTVAAMIGILRAGRTYLPIDAAYPESRVTQILSDAGVELILVPPGVSPPPGYTGKCQSIDHAIRSEPISGAAPDNSIAYVIFTSGSSGSPKGVRVSHQAAVYSTNERIEVYADYPVERFLLLSSFAFDSAVAGLWWTLSSGGCLHLAPRETVRAADATAELITREQITHTLCLASQWNDICRMADGGLKSMRLAIVAGEACSSATINYHFECAPESALFNEYGPTEMAVWSTYHRLSANDRDPVPIGQPLALTQALVVDDFGNLIPDGLQGELLLAGQGIASGYIGDIPGGFTMHPLDPASPAYRTGDSVYRGHDGLIYFSGRVDQQVKFRGYRIGIEAIEQSIAKSGAEVAVIPWDGKTLEDLFAKLPSSEAHALVDQLLTQSPDRGNKRQELSTEGDQFRIQIDLEPEFIAPPRPAQRSWLLRKLLSETAANIAALDILASRFVAGQERVATGDFASQSHTAPTDTVIMEDWQKPIMRAMAGIIGRHGGRVLEIGFGRGISAGYIQEHEIASHTIIESEKEVVSRYFEPWRAKHKSANIELLLGKWQDCQLSPASFDGVLFHAYPLDEAEFFEHIVQSITYAEHAIPAMANLLVPGGRFTYLSNEIDSLSRTHQRLLFRHFRKVRTEIIELDVPDDTKDAWWAPQMVIIECVR